MASLYSNPTDAYTEVATYTVTEAQQQALYDLLTGAANSWLRLLPGFITANVYLSEDRAHVVSQVEWRTREDWLNSRQHPEQAAIHTKIQALDSNIQADVQAYKAPQIITGPMPETGLVIPLWNDDDTTIPAIVAPHENLTVLLTGEQTSNLMTIVGFTNTPGDFNALHVHTREDEYWHIIEGEFEFEVGGKIHRAGPGSTVLGPRNIPHHFRYAGESGVGRLIIIYTPAGIERFFIQLDELAAKGTNVTPEMIVELSASVGTSLL